MKKIGISIYPDFDDIDTIKQQMDFISELGYTDIFTSIQLGFDTVLSFRAYCESEAEFEQYKQVLSDAYLEYDQIFSKYNIKIYQYENKRN